MIFHKYDSKPIFLTLPFCYEIDEELYHSEYYKQIIELKHKKSILLLKKVKFEIEKHSIEKPE